MLLVAAATWWVTQRGSPAQPQTRTVTVTNYAGRQGQPALSPDGTQLAFVWDGDRNENEDVYVKAIGEADALRLTTDPASDLWPIWSPDGKRLAFRRGDGVYTRPVLGGSERRIGTGLSIPNALGTDKCRGHPTGDGLPFLRQLDSSGCRLKAANRGLRRPPEVPVPSTARRHSPPTDGRWPFFGARAGSREKLPQTLSGAGTPDGPPRQRFDQAFRSGGLAWSRDGERLFFSGSPNASGLGSIWQVGVRTEDPPERLPLASDVTLAGISAAGERLAFVRILTGAQVWKVVNGRTEPLIRSAGQIFDWAGAFSPDGRKIAFQSGRLGNGDHIFAANADGSGVVQLTGKDVTFAATPDWSPDGKWLTFSTQRDDGGFDIAVMESSGGPARRLTAGNDNDRPGVFARRTPRVVHQYANRPKRNLECGIRGRPGDAVHVRGAHDGEGVYGRAHCVLPGLLRQSVRAAARRRSGTAHRYGSGRPSRLHRRSRWNLPGAGGQARLERRVVFCGPCRTRRTRGLRSAGVLDSGWPKRFARSTHDPLFALHPKFRR